MEKLHYALLHLYLLSVAVELKAHIVHCQSSQHSSFLASYTEAVTAKIRSKSFKFIFFNNSWMNVKSMKNDWLVWWEEERKREGVCIFLPLYTDMCLRIEINWNLLKIYYPFSPPSTTTTTKSPYLIFIFIYIAK